MAKKRYFASDSDVSRFISCKKNTISTQDLKTRQQVTYLSQIRNMLDNVKILAKVNDVNLNSMLLALIREAINNEQYQKIIHAYVQMKELTLQH